MPTLRVETNLSFAAIAGGGDTTCGLTAGGALHCWGLNLLGALGDGSGQNSYLPVPVGGGISWSSVSVGTYHVCGVDTLGEVRCWGGDRWDVVLGRLAGSECPAPLFEPTWPCEAAPNPLLSAGTYDWVEAGLYQTCAGAGGEAVCWGTNDAGQLGAATSQLCPGNDPLHQSERPCSRAGLAPDGPPLSHVVPGTTHSWWLPRRPMSTAVSTPGERSVSGRTVLSLLLRCRRQYSHVCVNPSTALTWFMCMSPSCRWSGGLDCAPPRREF